MTTPREPDGTSPGGTPPHAGPEHVEPGHRARALAASLLGELTGQRRGPSLLDPQPARPAPIVTPPPAAAGRTEADAREAAADLGRPVSAPPRPADVPRLAPSALLGGPARQAPPGPSASPTVSPAAAPAGSPAAAPTGVSAPPTIGAPTTPSGPPAPAPSAAAPVSAAPTGTAPLSAPSASSGPTSAPSAPTGPQQPGPSERSDRDATAPVEAPALPATREQVPDSPAAQDRAGDRGPDVRPAPFAYAAVAQHHTGPARATANGALDQAGQRISSRVDRGLARRAAQVTIEAASLLDACDVLDGRAQAVDATWTGERHSATEVREFEGAWGAFYDARGALAQHVTT